MINVESAIDAPKGKFPNRLLWNRLTTRAARLRIAARDAREKGAVDHAGELDTDADILIDARNRLFPTEPSW